ncbi:MAG: hypothetical protein UV19_C0004G0034 [Parcubacteria group bacterium GW2011_GWA2_42_28]|nr:MAG: hypothetical protein UV19_C0004G0034 [Parcubacteria group bacterium GW2011_GWA2_42_28]KKT55469.1 MAG: hypothetical protein UW45_C0007G0034 [Parcubacteria group bacterium GW2011_GWC2_44_22]
MIKKIQAVIKDREKRDSFVTDIALWVIVLLYVPLIVFTCVMIYSLPNLVKNIISYS